MIRAGILVLTMTFAAGCAPREEAAVVPPMEGSVCGDPQLRGEAVGAVAGAGSCGIPNAVRLREVAGVTLSTPATIDCATAEALKSWVETGIEPAFSDVGGGIAQLNVVAHYACRSRNNQSGARLSEHSFGRAIDIAGFELADGQYVSVLSDWGNDGYGARLRRVWQAACGPFGTVLGPESDVFHRDHFHVDTASYRSGSYCR